MIRKLVNLGIKDDLRIEEAQIVRLTNITAMIPVVAYLFYIWYGIYYSQSFSIWLASSMLTLTLVALVFNSLTKHGLAKTILFVLNSFSLWITYHVFNVDYSALTSFFPILFCLPLFFNIRKEANYFFISFALVVFFIASSFIMERHQIYSITLAPEVVAQSNFFHILISFLLTILVGYFVIKNQNKTYDKLIEEREKAEDTLEDLQSTQSQLIHSEKMASLGILLAGVSHEINNPLNFLKGSVEGLQTEIESMNGSATESSSQYLLIMKEGVDRIGNIVKSLNHFNYSSPTFDQECNIDSIINNCLGILNHELKIGIEVNKDFCDLSTIKGNSGQLHQVILNLLANSIHAVPKEGKIWLRTKEQGEFLNIIVEDNGEGIPPEKQYQIFDPFYTTKDPGKGTGLGLAIANRIVKQHGGDITIASEPGMGTAIRLRLPKDPSKLKS
ncbi:sensor histidine kinase [Ekhidna sp.]